MSALRPAPFRAPSPSPLLVPPLSLSPLSPGGTRTERRRATHWIALPTAATTQETPMPMPAA
ncbi:hypothetical protein AB0I10_05300 [Streptomyces sp. NPDC050636]|uniref:hypothetical protein n=1 Tax=Streptomyces sp. NPDC050636 TaxID=3154510 RepID=UPI00341CFA32